MKWAFLMEAGFARIVNCTPAGTPALPGLPTSYSSYWQVKNMAETAMIASEISERQDRTGGL
jgi:hypothetical protein